MNRLPPGIHPVRGVMGCCFVLVDENRAAVLLDTGLVGAPWFIRRRLRALGLGPRDVRAILLTHGHLDHTGDVAWAIGQNAAVEQKVQQAAQELQEVKDMLHREEAEIERLEAELSRRGGDVT